MNKIFEDIRKKVTTANYKSAFEFIAGAMEVLEKLQVPGAQKADMLLEYIEKCVQEYDSLDQGIKKELVQLKENGMIMPYVNTVCKVSKHIFKINRSNCFDGIWCNCFAAPSSKK